MNAPSKYILFSIVIAAVVFCGYLTGKHLSSISNNSQEQDFDSLRKAADYMAAVPSSGPIIKLQPITVTYDGHHAAGFLSTEEAAQVKPKQEVALYDKEGIILPLGGIVNSIEEMANKAKINIDLPEDTDTTLLHENQNIVVSMMQANQRVPHDAVLTDEEGKDFIWVATPARISPTNNQDTYTLKRQYIEKGYNNIDYVDVNAELASDELVVLDPDNKIKADKIYDLFVVTLDAPSQSPVRQAYVDYQQYLLEEWAEELEQLYQDCVSGKNQEVPLGDKLQGMSSLPDGTTTYNCQSAPAPLTPEQILNNLLNGNTGSACGSCGK